MKYTLGILLFLVTIFAQVQEASAKKKHINYRRYFKTLSVQQIKDLKQGALLVRLHTKKTTIAALRKNGNAKQADKVEQKQIETNKSIITAFRKNFDFCPVFFFYSDYSPFIIDRQFDKVVFLNNDLQADPTILFDKQNFLIAEFGVISQDTTAHFDSYYYENGENGLEKKAKYYGGSNMGFGALIICSDKSVQLHKPFPYYSRTYETLPFIISSQKVVSKMDGKLKRFYKRKSKKIPSN